MPLLMSQIISNSRSEKYQEFGVVVGIKVILRSLQEVSCDPKNSRISVSDKVPGPAEAKMCYLCS